MTNEVNVQTVGERIEYIESLNARGVGTSVESQQFELACLHRLLAALTTQPVKLTRDWVYIRFTDRSKSQRMKCQVTWSDSLNSVIYDEEGAPLLISNSAYEVQE